MATISDNEDSGQFPTSQKVLWDLLWFGPKGSLHLSCVAFYLVSFSSAPKLLRSFGNEFWCPEGFLSIPTL